MKSRSSASHTITGEVQGYSMSPLMQPGDVLYIKKTKTDFEIGDIVVFSLRNKLISHRLISFGNSYIITKGDNVFETEKVFKKYIIGKLISIEGKYGTIYLESRLSKILKYYYLFHSTTTRNMSLFVFHIWNNLIRGRRFLTKLQSKRRVL